MGICSICFRTEGVNEKLIILEKDGEYCMLCSHCFNYSSIKLECPVCSREIFSKHQAMIGANGVVYCNNCYPFVDSLPLNYNNNNFRLMSYHDSRLFDASRMFAGNGRIARCLFGFEIELEAKERANRNRNKDAMAIMRNAPLGSITIERDSSLECGIEIITSPMSRQFFYRKGFDEISRILRCAESLGYEQRRNTGLHIHVCRDYFGRSQRTRIANIVKLLFLIERNFETIALVSGRTRAELSDWASSTYLIGALDAKRTAYNLATRVYTQKYLALNCSHSETVEFRFFRSTTDPMRLLDCVEFCLWLCDVAKSLKDADEACEHELDINDFLESCSRKSESSIAQYVLD